MDQIRKNILWNALGNTAYNLLQWLITVEVTHLSGFETAGVLAIAMSLSLTLRSVSYFGVRDFQVTDSKNSFSHSDYLSLRCVTCLASLLMCTAVCVISSYSREVFTAIMLFMLFRISEAFSDLFRGIMQKNERLDLSGAALLIRAVIFTVSFFLGYLLRGSLTDGLLLMSLSSLAAVAVTDIPMSGMAHKNALKITFINITAIARQTLPMFVFTLETAIILNTPKYFLSLFSDNEAVGIYSSVFSLALILQGLFQYVYTPFITAFSALETNREYSRMRKLAGKIFAVFLAMTLLFLIISILFGETAMTVVYGKHGSYTRIMIPAVVSVCLFSATNFLSLLAVVKREMSMLIKIHTLSAAVFIFSEIVLIPTLGINGASYGVIISALFACIFLSIICFNNLKSEP